MVGSRLGLLWCDTAWRGLSIVTRGVIQSPRHSLFFQWSNGNIMKFGEFELGRSSRFQSAAQVSARVKATVPSTSGLYPMAAPLKRKKIVPLLLLVAFP